MTSGRVLAGTSLILGGVISWMRLDFLTFEGRIIVSAVAVLILLVAFACEFPDRTWRMRNERRLRVAMLWALPFALLAVALAFVTTVWHSVMLAPNGQCTASMPGWACIDVRLPNHSVQFELQLAVTDLDGPQADWSGNFWADDRDTKGAYSTKRANQPHQFTVLLTGVGSSIRYGVAYRTAPNRQLTIDTPGIRLIAWPTLWRWLAFELGALWILGACLLYYSPSWVPLLAPRAKDPPKTDILVR